MNYHLSMLVPKNRKRSNKNLEDLKRECRVKIWVPLVFIFAPLLYLAFGLDLDKFFSSFRHLGILGALIFIGLVILLYGLCLSTLFKGLLLAREIDEISGTKTSKLRSSTFPVLIIIGIFIFIGWKTGLLRLLFNTL